MSDTWKAILGGIAIAILLGIVAILIYLLFEKFMGVIAGFFVWMIIYLSGLGV